MQSLRKNKRHNKNQSRRRKKQTEPIPLHVLPLALKPSQCIDEDPPKNRSQPKRYIRNYRIISEEMITSHRRNHHHGQSRRRHINKRESKPHREFQKENERND